MAQDTEQRQRRRTGMGEKRGTPGHSRDPAGSTHSPDCRRTQQVGDPAIRRGRVGMSAGSPPLPETLISHGCKADFGTNYKFSSHKHGQGHSGCSVWPRCLLRPMGPSWKMRVWWCLGPGWSILGMGVPPPWSLHMYARSRLHIQGLVPQPGGKQQPGFFQLLSPEEAWQWPSRMPPPTCPSTPAHQQG